LQESFNTKKGRWIFIKILKKINFFFLLCFILSIFFHILTIRFFSIDFPEPVLQKPVLLLPLKIIHDEASLVETKKPVKQKLGKDKKHRHKKSYSKNDLPAPNVPASSYADLLDGLKFERLTDDTLKESSTENAYSGKFHGELLQEANNLSVEFDLPLKFRRDVKDAEAWVYLKLETSSILIKSLNGTPEVRAALFKMLSDKKSYSKLLRIFDFFKKEKFSIRVEYKTEYGFHGNEFETQCKILDDKILIETTHFLRRYEITPSRFQISRDSNSGTSMISLGFPIDDKDAKLARERDKADLEDLRNSSAYQSPVSNYVLTP